MNPDQMMRDYFGDNYDKAMKVAAKTKADARVKFLKKHPYADMSKFNISVYLNKSGGVESVGIDYIVDDQLSVDITTDSFKNNKQWKSALGWPGLWVADGTIQPFTPNSGNMESPNIIKIFAAEDLFFLTNLEAFDISGSFDPDYKKSSYTASLYAAYIATYLCGMSTKHFKYKPSVSNIITSLARYHLYYQMMRFMKNPSKMSRYMSADVRKIINDHRPVKNVWEWKIHFGQEELGTWIAEQPRGTIRNARPKLKGNFGQVGITYQKLTGKTIRSPDDYKIFIATKSDGLTKTGELLFQQSMESYVYCVLGAQARTRWPIVRSGARSLQTQEVFRKLVGDTVLQDDHTVTLSNMRGAIKSTNVVLNTAVVPGVILVPSDMIILDKMIPGYNNVLTIAKGEMKFGHNENVNYFKHETIRLAVKPKPQTKTLDSSNETDTDTGTDTDTTPAPKVLTTIPEINRNTVLNTVPHLSTDNLYVFLASGAVGSAAAWMFL